MTLGGLGLTVLRTAGPGTVSVGLLLGAALALAVFLADLPLRTEGDEEGLVRVCILRRGCIPWDRGRRDRTSAPTAHRGRGPAGW